MAITLSILNGFSKLLHCWQIPTKSMQYCPAYYQYRTTLRSLEVRVLAYLEENATEM